MGSDRPATPPEISVIIPARNEEACLADCLNSLLGQGGVPFEIIVVDDYSTDRTREIAANFPGVYVISPPPVPRGWTGKNNAVWAGACKAQGGWLLFTDADTVHIPGSLARAWAEAKEYGVDMLSYSPEQIAVTFWEMAVLPVVFAELARRYPPKQVSDPASPTAAANGQYILIGRGAYDAIGGHRAIAGDLLEDVALAGTVKRSGRKLRFRYGADAVRTRMYRNLRQLQEGWTKNLALLFPEPGRLAAKILLVWGVAWFLFVLPMITRLAVGLALRTQPLLHAKTLALVKVLDGILNHSWLAGITVLGLLYLPLRLRHSNFTWDRNLLAALFGMPMFAYLLLRSKRAHGAGEVYWKGRAYTDEDRSQAQAAERIAAGESS